MTSHRGNHRLCRVRGNTQANRGSAWYGGDLFPAGDDYLLYETAEAFFLPVTGTALSPGELNTGSAAESPLASLVSVRANANGTVTATFSAPISQVLSGDAGAASPGGSGITITDTNGVEISTIDIRPQVSGLETGTLTLSFTGPAVVGGQLPAGSYRLNFVGNGIIGNGRAVDVANDGTEIDAFFTFEFTVEPVLPGDYDRNGTVEQEDYDFWKSHFGEAAGIGLQADGNGNGVVDAADYTVWRNNLGATLPGSGNVAATAAESSADTSDAAEAVVVLSNARPAALDAALVELPNTRTTSGNFRRVRAAAPAQANPAAADQWLLLLAKRYNGTTGLERQKSGKNGADQGRADEFDCAFAQLGESPFAVEFAGVALGHPV